MDEALDLLWHEEGRPDAGRTDFHAAVNTARGRIRDLLGTQQPMVIPTSLITTGSTAMSSTSIYGASDPTSNGPRLRQTDTTQRDCLEHACALVAGEPFAGLRGTGRSRFARSCASSRERAGSTRRAARGRRSGRRRHRGAQSACAADSYDEAFARRLIRLQLDHGQREAADRSYRVLAVRLAELGTEPDDETDDLRVGHSTTRWFGMAARPTGPRSAVAPRVAIVDTERRWVRHPLRCQLAGSRATPRSAAGCIARSLLRKPARCWWRPRGNQEAARCGSLLAPGAPGRHD
jgi:hypothetical protein